jgi:shikimate dehydrogenase
VLSAQSRVAGVIGDPVHQSLSPTLHNAAFEALDLDWVYVAFPVRAGQGAAAVEAMRVLGLDGLSVTMPHKATATAGVDRLSPTAARLGVLNTVTRHGVELVGESTDGPGLVDALRVEQGWEPVGRHVVVLGTGGAARAVTLALAEAGATELTVVGRRRDAAESCAALAGAVGTVGSIDSVAGAELVVNATPVGMVGPDGAGAVAGGRAEPGLPLGLDGSRLAPGQLVVDLVYAPAVTPLLIAARRRGVEAVNGLGMLVHQAGRQFAAWTGLAPPLEAMRAAALAELGRRDAGGLRRG